MVVGSQNRQTVEGDEANQKKDDESTHKKKHFYREGRQTVAEASAGVVSGSSAVRLEKTYKDDGPGVCSDFSERACETEDAGRSTSPSVNEQNKHSEE